MKQPQISSLSSQLLIEEVKEKSTGAKLGMASMG
jgi:hypothetical protein